MVIAGVGCQEDDGKNSSSDKDSSVNVRDSQAAVDEASDRGPPPDVAGQCQPRRILLNRQMPRHIVGKPAPECRITEDGAAILKFSQYCEDAPHHGCQIAEGQDFSMFDNEQGGQGLLEVRFCVEGTSDGAINLRYEAGTRKFFRLLPMGEILSNGCRTTYLAPADACAPEGCPTNCMTDGGVGDGPPDAPADEDASTLQCPQFRSSNLVVMSEWCGETPGDSPGPVQIKIISITYYPKECLCDDGLGCPAAHICRRDGWHNKSACGSHCPGICTDR
jgi:hypothetical protein